MVRTRLSCTGAIALILCALAAPASASTAFDMEGVTPGFYAGSLMVADGPLTLTVTPQGNSSGYVVADDPKVPLLGSVALIGSNKDFLASGQYTPLRFSFNQSIDSITFNFGDAGGDDDGTVEIRAYSVGNSFDTFLGSVSADYGVGTAGDSLTLNFSGADYFVALSGGSNENSLYWEVAAITPAAQVGAVPEPAAGTMMLMGLFGLGWASRLARHRRTARASVAC